MIISKTLLTISLIDCGLLSLLAFGLTYIIVGSVIGETFRSLFCWITQKVDSFWFLVICPPCNSFWVMGILSYLEFKSILISLVLAVIQTGLVAAFQVRVGGYGIASTDASMMGEHVNEMNRVFKESFDKRKGA